MKNAEGSGNWRGASMRVAGGTHCWCVWVSMAALALCGIGISFGAEVRTFLVNNQAFVLEDVTPGTRVFFRAMRFSEATERWNADVIISNASSRPLSSPVIVSIEAFTNTTGPLTPDGTASGRVFFAFGNEYYGGSGDLAPGATTRPRTITLGYVEGAGVPSLQTRVFAAPGSAAFALALTRTLNGAGQPLPSVQIRETGPAGERHLKTDTDYGVATVGSVPGDYVWKFSRDGYLPVWRWLTLAGDTVQLLPTPRLIERSANSNVVNHGAGMTVSDSAGLVQLELTPNAFGQDATVVLTMLDGQTLPGPLPQGWTPLRAFWFEATLPSAQPTRAVVSLDVTPGENLWLARWDENAVRWRAEQLLVPASAIEAILPATGAYAIVLPDTGALAPPTPLAGALLPRSTPPPQPSPEFAGSGVVTPQVSAATRAPQAVTATAMVTISNRAGLLPSGLTLPALVSETYRLQDGTSRLTPTYDTFITAYRSPNEEDEPEGNTALHASFPMRPLLLFGPEELAEAAVRVKVLTAEAFSGAVLQPAGGTISNAQVRIFANEGTVAAPQGAVLRTLPQEELSNLVGTGHAIVAGFDLTVTGIESNRSLALQVPMLPAGRDFILARILSDIGHHGLEPVERLQSTTNGALMSIEPLVGARLPGLRRSGQYVLVQAPSNHALITGSVRNTSGNSVPGAFVRITGLPWMTFTDATGGYRLISPTGALQVAATDLSNAEADFIDVIATDPMQATTVDVVLATRGPRVLSVIPANGAASVSRITPITIAFSQALDGSTVVSTNILLLASNGLPVAATVSLNLRRTAVTLLPVDPLQPSSEYTLVLTTGVIGAHGAAVEGQRQFSFRTESSRASSTRTELIIFQPGATNIPIDVLTHLVGYQPGRDMQAVVVHGTRGAAEPTRPVILMNESSGETSTVLSKEDGSFYGVITGEEADFVSAVLVNANGTQNYLPVSRQEFDNGFVGLFSGGGILEAESDGGGVQVIVEPGTVTSREKLRITPINLAQLLPLLNNTQPEGGRLLGAVQYEEQGSGLRESADITFSVREEDLGLPVGTPPSSASFALTIPRKYNGNVVYEIIDTMAFEPTGPGTGRLVTRSPPYVGLLLRKIAEMEQNTLRFNALGTISLASTADASSTDETRTTLLGFVSLQGLGVTTIAGKVMSSQVDDTGRPVGAKQPVAGAVVSVDFGLLESAPIGLFRAGEFVATSDREGTFAFALTPLESGAARVLRAVHPRFPFTKAVSPGVLPTTIGAKAINVELLFAIPETGPVKAAGVAPPVVQVTHEPLFPSVGLTDSDGTRLKISASDDGSVKDLQVEAIRAQGLLDDGDMNPDSIVITPGTRDDSNPARMFQEFVIKTTNTMRASFRILASDGSGNTTVVPYQIPFGGNRPSVSAQNTNDVRGPRVAGAWPPNNSERIPSFSPIFIRFNEPIAPVWLEQNNRTWIGMGDRHRVISIQASADYREIHVYFNGDPEADVVLTIGAPLTDANNNVFDQLPATPAPDPFILTFRQSGLPSAPLPGITSGGGVALQGRFAYALERRGAGGFLVSYDLGDPTAPSELDRLTLAGLPTDLALISEYSLMTGVSAAAGQSIAGECAETTLLAVFTGSATETKRLTLVPLNTPFPGLFARPVSAPVSFSEASMIVKAKWDPPFLGYLETGAEITSISLLLLNAFHTGVTAGRSTRDEFPESPYFGVDLNFDGDFCDENESPPLPARTEGQVFGLAFSYAPEDPSERILDADFNSAFGLVGTVFHTPGTPVSGYRTVLAGLDDGVLPEAVLLFPANSSPKRVLIVPGITVATPTGTTVKDLALVSFGGTQGWVGVIDISDPRVPTLAMRIDLPSGEGSANSIQRRSDGLLAVATGGNTILLDPGKLLLPVEGQLTHPAIVGRIDGIGGGIRSFVTDGTGINLVNAGSNQQLIQTGPQFDVVTFGNSLPLAAADVIASRPHASIREYMDAATPISIAQVATLFPQNGTTPLPPNSQQHYYVVVRALGSAGRTLDLAAVATDARGGRINSSFRMPLPSVLADPTTSTGYRAAALAEIYLTASSFFSIKDAFEAATTAHDKLIAGENSLKNRIEKLFDGAGGVKDIFQKASAWVNETDEFPSTLTAHRLSSDPTSSLYNMYLAGPIVLLDRPVTEEQLGALQEELPRHYLKASHTFWVGLGRGSSKSEQEDHPALAPFMAKLTQASKELVLESGSAESFALKVLSVHRSGLGKGVESMAEDIAKLISEFDPILLPGAHVRKPVAITTKPIVFVPGIMGSELYDEEDGNGNVNVWVPGQFFNLVSSAPLDLNPDGTSLRPGIHASDVTRKVLIQEVYGPFLQFLVNDLGHVEYDFAHGRLEDDRYAVLDVAKRPALWYRTRLLHGPKALPNLGQEPRPSLFVFAYDWRQDNRKSAEQLREFIDLVLEIHPEAEKVDLIAHSMGGLVSRRFMLDHPNLVDRFISIGTPWMGSAKMLPAALLGDMDELSLNVIMPRKTVRRLLRFMPSAHQLMPAKGLFDLGLNPLFEAGWDANRNGVGYEPYNYAMYTNTLREHLFEEVFEEFNTAGPSPAVDNHEALHGDPLISDWRGDNLDIQYFHIFGMQSAPNSPGRVALSTKLVPVQPTDNNLTLEAPAIEYRESDDAGGEDRPEARFLMDKLPLGSQQYKLVKSAETLRVAGDGTVPILSLARGGGSQKDRNSPRARLLPLVSANSHTDKLVSHNEEFSNPRLHEMVAQILRGDTPETSRVTITPASNSSFEGETNAFAVSFTKPPGASGGASVVWDFGDGGTVVQHVDALGGSTVQHIFLDDGEYTVSCGVTFENGVAGYTSITVVVQNQPPTVRIENGNIQVPVGASPVLIARAVDPGIQDKHFFHWDFDGDGETDFDGSFVATPSFPAAGIYEVKVTAEDQSGGFSEHVVTVTVTDGVSEPPPPNIAAPDFQLPSGGAQQVYVHIAGHDFGFTDGITVRRGDNPILFSLGLPSFADLTTQLLRAASSARSEDGDKESVYVSVFRETENGQPVQEKSAILFSGAGRRVLVNALYLDGGVPQKRMVWEEFMVPTALAEFQFDWTTLEGTLSMTVRSEVGADSADIQPRFVATGLEAADRNGPSVAVVENQRTDRLFVIARDLFTPESNLALFIGEDTNNDGDFAGEPFYQLTNNTFLEIAAPSRPYMILARDSAGNLSEVRGTRAATSLNVDFKYASSGAPGDPFEPEFCEELQFTREALRQAVQDGLTRQEIKAFLLHEDDVWFFEQGSGACLWKGNEQESCEGCEAAFKPHKSDNDYELFLPVHKVIGLTREEFLQTDPHSIGNMEGDWYFKPPKGIDITGAEVDSIAGGAANPAVVSWRYSVPIPLANQLGETEVTIPRPSAPSAGNPFFNPVTPAQAIAFFFTATVMDNAEFRRFLPEVSFFPFRREHFTNAVMSLEKPPPFGDDPVGDAGMGRHLLLVKWLLEGAYVNFGPGSPLNDNVVPVDTIFETLRTSGIPTAEGYEWGIYQDWAALKEGARLRVERTDLSEASVAAVDDFRKRDEKLIKKVGKAAIRTAMAYIAGDPAFNPQILSRTPAQYASAGFQSFEHYIAFLATNQSAGPFQSEASRISGFLRAKVADPAFLDSLIEKREVATFIQDAITFMRGTVQEHTRSSYVSYLADLASSQKQSELAARKINHHEIEHGFTAGGQTIPGRRQLLGEGDGVDHVHPINFAVYNFGPHSSSSLQVKASTLPSDDPAPAVARSRKNGSSPPTDSFDRKETVEVGVIGPNDRSDVVLGSQEPPTGVIAIENSAAPRTRVLELKIEGNAPGNENHPKDDRIVFRVQMLPNPISPPALSEPTVALEVFLRSPVGVKRLDDYPPLQMRPRSPRFRLARTDEIVVQVTADPNHSYQLRVQSESDTTGIVADLVRVVGNRFVLASPDHHIRVQPQSQQPESGIQAAIAVKDEEILTFTVIQTGAGPVGEPIEVMVDRGEFAGGGLLFSNRAIPDQPRAFMTDRFTGSIPEQDLMFFDAGSSSFVDSVGPNNPHPFRTFAQNFGGSLPDSGEADILFTGSHGLVDGSLLDHDTISDLGVNPILVPEVHLASPTLWRNDADIAILFACNALSAEEPLFGQSGRVNWETAMRRPRPVRIILGFVRGVDLAMRELTEFTRLLQANARVIPAWEVSMNRHDGGFIPRAYGALFYVSAVEEKTYEMSKHPQVGETIAFVSIDNPGTTGCPFGVSNNTRGTNSPSEASEALPVATAAAPQVFTNAPWLTRAKLPSLTYSSFGYSETLLSEKPTVDFAATPLTSSNAADLGAAVLSDHLAGTGITFRLSGISAKRIGKVLPGEPLTTVTNGFVLFFDHLWQGIPIQNDGTSIEIIGTNITRISSTLNIPSGVRRGGEQSRQLLTPKAALDRATTAANGRLPRALNPEAAELRFIALPQKHTQDRATPPGRLYVPAWKFAHSSNAPPGTDGSDITWIDALSGEVVKGAAQ